MDIAGIPDSIPRSRMLDLIKALGIDPRDLLSLRMEPNTIYAQVWAVNEQGGRYLDGSREDYIAQHEIAIQVIGD